MASLPHSSPTSIAEKENFTHTQTSLPQPKSSSPAHAAPFTPRQQQQRDMRRRRAQSPRVDTKMTALRRGVRLGSPSPPAPRYQFNPASSTGSPPMTFSSSLLAQAAAATNSDDMDTDMEDASSPSTSSSGYSPQSTSSSSSSSSENTRVLKFAKVLARPAPKEPSAEALVAINPALATIPVQYIRDTLKQVSSGMMLTVARATAQIPKNAPLPREVPVLVGDVSADIPTHMLAVYSKPRKASSTSSSPPKPQQIKLYPAHSIVYATQCTNLPPLPSHPSHKTTQPKEPGSSVTLPTFPMCLPAPESFPVVHGWLYHNDPVRTLGILLPHSPELVLEREQLEDLLSEDEEDRADARQCLIDAFRATYSPQKIAEVSLIVHGVWSNAVVMGITDPKFWSALDAAWAVLMCTFADTPYLH